MLRCRISLQRSGWERHGAILDFGMAIRAQKHALTSLGTQPRQRQRHALRVDFDPLLVRPNVVEMQRAHAPRVSADRAHSARLAYEDLLHLAATSRYRLGSATPAAVVAPAIAHVLRASVARARHPHHGHAGLARRPRLRRSPSPPAAACLQAVTLQPVTHRRLASIRPRRDLGNRQSFLDHRLQLVQGQASFCGVPLAIVRPQSMPIQPVCDRRFVTAESPSDLRERQAFVEHLLQRGAIHAPYCLQRAGREIRTGVRVGGVWWTA